MRALMHIIPHIAMIGLIVFINIIGYSQRVHFFCYKGKFDNYSLSLIVAIYIVGISWLPSLLVETLLY